MIELFSIIRLFSSVIIVIFYFRLGLLYESYALKKVGLNVYLSML